jgi:hypothetical protein
MSQDRGPCMAWTDIAASCRTRTLIPHTIVFYSGHTSELITDADNVMAM